MKTDNRPNILFLHTDQHRFDYMGCAGANFMNTPNLDRLAERGLRFNNCFSNSLVETIDLNPTICDLAGLSRQSNIDARSLYPTLENPSLKHRDEAVSVIRNWMCVRTERYKLINNRYC